MKASSSTGAPLPIQFPQNDPGKQQNLARVLEGLSSTWGTQMKLLTSAWPNPGCYGHSRSETANAKFNLSLPDSPFLSLLATWPFKPTKMDDVKEKNPR